MMRTKINFPNYLFYVLILLSLALPSRVQAQYDGVSLETFYQELSPYGVWIYDPQYGNVWRPDVDQEEFRPYYSDGHWEMTKYGNTWVSDYEWGWAPFHYGRWIHTNRRGWLWIPDTKWGPAWVTWRSGNGYYGWAPLGPGIHININIGPRIPDYYWVFVPQPSIYYSRFPRYDRRRNISIFSRTVIINNTYVINNNRYYAGPRIDEIRRVTRRPVVINEVRNIRSEGYAGSNNRPEVIRNADRGGSPGNNPRPTRTNDNEVGRGSVNDRNGANTNGKIAERPENRQIPASSQRTNRTYDNQSSREVKNPTSGGISEPRQGNNGAQQGNSSEARQQKPARAQQSQSPQRVQTAERAQRTSSEESRPAPSQNSRTQREEPSRNNVPAVPERSGKNESRPGRVQ
jgi:hypothetical protein